MVSDISPFGAPATPTRIAEEGFAKHPFLATFDEVGQAHVETPPDVSKLNRTLIYSSDFVVDGHVNAKVRQFWN